MSERVKIDTLTERVSEKPQTPQPIKLDNYVTKVVFDHQISMKDQEIVSLKQRLQLTDSRLAQTQTDVSAIQEQLADLSAPPLQTQKDNTTEGGRRRLKKNIKHEKGKERSFQQLRRSLVSRNFLKKEK